MYNRRPVQDLDDDEEIVREFEGRFSYLKTEFVAYPTHLSDKVLIS